MPANHAWYFFNKEPTFNKKHQKRLWILTFPPPEMSKKEIQDSFQTNQPTNQPVGKVNVSRHHENLLLRNLGK